MTAMIGGPSTVLASADVERFITDQLATLDLDGRTLCVVIPDATRSCPLPLLMGAVVAATGDRVRACTAVVALGTHAAMTSEAMREMVGVDGLEVVNHAWWDDSTYASIGELPAETVEQLSEGRLSEPVEVRINRLVVDADVTLIVGPVLPHEVIGFSGGNKYLFPGLSGPELIDVTHWLGALLTSRAIIGSKGTTPVRALVDAAAALVPGEQHALCVVTDPRGDGLHSLAFGEPRDAWARAADVAAETHISYLTEPVRRVVSIVSPRYEDLWTGAKGFYKVEPVVADGGEVILYAPHIGDIALTHPGIADIGYHCTEYFLAQWDRFDELPRGELAHSTHLFGSGTFSPDAGEHQRVSVTLATGIPADIVAKANLGYLDPAQVDIESLRNDPDTLVVENGGEVLYRLRGTGT